MSKTSWICAISVLAGGLSMHAQTLAATRGSYSFAEEGVNAQGLRYSRIGTFQLDGNGGAVGTSISKTGAASAVASSLTGSYLMADDGTISVQFVTTETTTDGENVDTITVLNSSMKLIASGKNRLTGLRTDPGINAVVQAEPLSTATATGALTYTLIEDGVSTLNAPYSRVGTVQWDARTTVSANVIEKTSIFDSMSLNGTLTVDPNGIGSMVLEGVNSDGDETFRASYAGVPMNDGKDWALIRVDAGVLGSGKLLSR